MKLNATNIKKITPPENGYVLHWDDDLHGFGLRVTKAGAKAYIAQAKIQGKARRVTIGRHGVITTAQARKRAHEILGDMAGGTDPAVEKSRRKALSTTLEAVTEDYLSNRKTKAGKQLKERTKSDIRYHLKHSFPEWRNRPVAKINREMIERRYRELCERSVAQANQAMRNLRAIITFAAANRTADGERIITENPVLVLSEKSLWSEVEARQTKVDKDKLGCWWSTVQAMRSDPALHIVGKTAVDLVALLALTGLRLGEARSLRWDQVDLENASLTLTDTKNRTDVTLPLSEPAREILEQRPRKAAWVFPSRSGKGCIKGARETLALLAEQTGVEVSHHDLRRTFIQAGLYYLPKKERIEFYRVKLLTNHKIPKNDVTLSSYADDPDRTFLKDEADRIANYFEEQRRIFEAGNVVPMEHWA